MVSRCRIRLGGTPSGRRLQHDGVLAECMTIVAPLSTMLGQRGVTWMRLGRRDELSHGGLFSFGGGTIMF